MKKTFSPKRSTRLRKRTSRKKKSIRGGSIFNGSFNALADGVTYTLRVLGEEKGSALFNMYAPSPKTFWSFGTMNVYTSEERMEVKYMLGVCRKVAGMFAGRIISVIGSKTNGGEWEWAYEKDNQKYGDTDEYFTQLMNARKKYYYDYSTMWNIYNAMPVLFDAMEREGYNIHPESRNELGNVEKLLQDLYPGSF